MSVIHRFAGVFAVAALTLSFSSFAQSSTSAGESAKAHVELAASYLQAGRNSIALEEAQRALQLDPKYSPARDLMGIISMQEGQLDKAEEHFKAAIELDADNGDAHNNYGLLLCRSQRVEQAMEQFGQALTISRYPRVAQTLVNGGICLRQKGDLSAAEKYFVKALETEPFMPSALYQLSLTYFQEGKLLEAASRLDALHRQMAPRSDTLFLQIQIERSLGRTDAARKHARDLQLQFPQSSEARQLGMGQ